MGIKKEKFWLSVESIAGRGEGRVCCVIYVHCGENDLQIFLGSCRRYGCYW